MNNYNISKEEQLNLRVLHKSSKNKRDADRIKSIYLLSKNWSVKKVSEALLLDDNTIRNYLNNYKLGGINKLLENNAGGSTSKLSIEHQNELDKHLQETLYLTSKSVSNFIKNSWNINYTESGTKQLLHRLGFVYKKTKLIPGKADVSKQLEFIDKYETLKKNKSEDETILFMDATHPQHNPISSYAWIKKGMDHEIRTNTGRKRLNINGVIDSDTLLPIVRYDDSINAQSTILLFKMIEEKYLKSAKIYIICDNARYYRSKLVKEYLKSSNIELVFLPAYAPNLNLIERYWKFFKKKVLYGKYYQVYDEFVNACTNFFKNKKKYTQELKRLLTDNFQIIGKNSIPIFEKS